MKKIMFVIAIIAITVAIFSCTKGSDSEKNYENFVFIQDSTHIYKVIVVDTFLRVHGEAKILSSEIHSNSLTKQFDYVIMPSDGKLMNNELHENAKKTRVK